MSPKILRWIAHTCGQPQLAEQDSRNRVGVRILRHLRLPVPGNGPAVQFRSADFPVHIGRDLPVRSGVNGPGSSTWTDWAAESAESRRARCQAIASYRSYTS